MKSISSSIYLLVSLFLLAAVGCNKDDDFLPSDLSKFYRLNSFEVGVVPATRTVQVLFQVRDYHNKGVTSLMEDDFVVTENNGKIDSEADLRVGRSTIPFSLRTVLLLDITRSVEGLVPQIKSAAKALIQKKLPEQEIAIYTFDAETIEQKVLDALNDSYSINGIVDGSLVIFTDGRHSASQAITLNNALNALEDRRAYVAALNSPDLDEGSLQALAKNKDRYFKAEDVAGLEKMFLDIQDEIQSLSNSIYFMYYQSPISDPSPYENNLKIEIRNNSNVGGDSRIVEKCNSVGFGN